MDRQYGEAYFSSVLASDLERGGIGIEVTRNFGGQRSVVAKVFYWDASGGFTLQTFDGDVPVEIIEELIAEAKKRIRRE